MRPVFLFAKQMYILIQRIINISVLDKLLSGFMEKKNGETSRDTKNENKRGKFI
jgi:hypothetical protein